MRGEVGELLPGDLCFDYPAFVPVGREGDTLEALHPCPVTYTAGVAAPPHRSPYREANVRAARVRGTRTPRRGRG